MQQLFGLQIQQTCWVKPFLSYKRLILTVKYLLKITLISLFRFYFTNWHGVNESVPRVCRHALKRKNANGPKTEPEGNPLLDTASLKYLFAQVSFHTQNIFSQSLKQLYSQMESSSIHNHISWIMCLCVWFSKGQHDFVKGWATLRNPQNEEEVHYIENECLGMAVLSISHHALDNNIVIPGVAGQIR